MTPDTAMWTPSFTKFKSIWKKSKAANTEKACAAQAVIVWKKCIFAEQTGVAG